LRVIVEGCTEADREGEREGEALEKVIQGHFGFVLAMHGPLRAGPPHLHHPLAHLLCVAMLLCAVLL